VSRSSDKISRVAKELGKLCEDETSHKPPHMFCLGVVERHYDAACAALQCNNRQQVAAFCFEKERAALIEAAKRRAERPW
jgi:hypothetical protein